ncbi:uncharacterized protein ANIA_11385 [Aspergillus nidulans FGSC A4]|uniref:Uncharacterized protein n=1 Tax=Emericella nidulans (strain FGSC A4 / ATCC 38163 / CBS 112.46 / NRRL 194 / M139) TaxID=227321 RepID=C8VHX8_EMENI|nr:hypothetical protein [Aspergillus nidulans FGSC A4]CBF82960.1 TPA: hypothetical protein ANIA_11385 [Aspergillus nidulans FGSC A4]
MVVDLGIVNFENDWATLCMGTGETYEVVGSYAVRDSSASHHIAVLLMDGTGVASAVKTAAE